MVIAGLDNEPDPNIFKHDNEGDEEEKDSQQQDMNSTFTVWKGNDTGSTEGTDSPGRHPEDVRTRQSIVLRGLRQDHGDETATTKKSDKKKSGIKKVGSIMSSMKKFVVKKVYGTG